MNNVPDKDAQLTNFLRQNRSIAPLEQSELEDRLMSEIDALPIERQQRISRSWRRYIAGGIGLPIAVSVGVVIFQVMNPPEPSMAELDRLNLYLEANIPELIGDSDASLGKHEDLDLDEDLL
jgi:hypothetical protein